MTCIYCISELEKYIVGVRLTLIPAVTCSVAPVQGCLAVHLPVRDVRGAQEAT